MWTSLPRVWGEMGKLGGNRPWGSFWRPEISQFMTSATFCAAQCPHAHEETSC